MATYLLIGTLVVLVCYIACKDAFRVAVETFEEFEGFSKILGMTLMLAGLILIWPILIFGLVFDNRK